MDGAAALWLMARVVLAAVALGWLAVILIAVFDIGVESGGDRERRS